MTTFASRLSEETIRQWKTNSIKSLTEQTYKDLSFLALDARVTSLCDEVEQLQAENQKLKSIVKYLNESKYEDR